MGGKTKIDRTIAVLTLIVSGVAAYYAYRSYHLEGSGQLVVMFYAPNESVTDTWNIDSTKIKHDKGFMEFELPLELSNISETDVNHITVLIGPESGDNYNLSLIKGGCGWITTLWNQQQWEYQDVGNLQPRSRTHRDCIMIHAKEGTKEVKLTWYALASHMLPKTGTLVIPF